MKIFKIIVLFAIIVFGGFMKAVLPILMRMGFWPGLIGVLALVALCVLLTVWNASDRRRARADEAAAQAGEVPKRYRISPFDQSKIGRILAAYPGPITLAPSQPMLWFLLMGSILMTGASIFVGFIAFWAMQAGQKDAGLGLGLSLVGTFFFGLGLAVSVSGLLRGGMRLDSRGFELVILGRTRYLWSEVSNFRPYYVRSVGTVQFDAIKPRLPYYAPIRVALGYSNDSLSAGVYGFEAEELADLMEAWRDAALNGPVSSPPLAPTHSGQPRAPVFGKRGLSHTVE